MLPPEPVPTFPPLLAEVPPEPEPTLPPELDVPPDPVPTVPPLLELPPEPGDPPPDWDEQAAENTPATRIIARNVEFFIGLLLPRPASFC